MHSVVVVAAWVLGVGAHEVVRGGIDFAAKGFDAARLVIWSVLAIH